MVAMGLAKAGGGMSSAVPGTLQEGPSRVGVGIPAQTHQRGGEAQGSTVWPAPGLAARSLAGIRTPPLFSFSLS